MPKKLTYEFVKEYINNTGEELISECYTNSESKLEIKCRNCKNVYFIDWNHFRRGQRCCLCAGNFKLTLEYIKKETKKRAKGYECLATEYINSQTKYNNRCNQGHIYETCWNVFNTGSRCPICYNKNRTGKNHPKWKGGKDLVWYDTYKSKIDWCEKVRRDPKNKDYLQAKCKNSKCKKWFTPTEQEIYSRLYAISGDRLGDSNFYCSDKCKKECSLYNRRKYLKGFKKDSSRPDQKEWADMVKQRDDYTCQKCGRKDLPLVAHHIEGLNINPIESADIDLGITVCSECDKLVHKDKGCRKVDLRKESLCR